jgi:hypothetical protein
MLDAQRQIWRAQLRSCRVVRANQCFHRFPPESDFRPNSSDHSQALVVYGLEHTSSIHTERVRGVVN